MLELLTAILKGITYLTALSGAGILLAHWSLLRGEHDFVALKQSARISAIMLALAAVAAAVVYTFRLGDAFTGQNIIALLSSPLGLALSLQIAGGLWLAFLAGRSSAIVGAFAILLSFGVVGHSATRGIASAASVLVHITAAAWWLGGLWTLLAASQALACNSFAALVRTFSRQAIWVVGLLIVAAIVTAAQLLNLQIDFTQEYDLGLIAKAGLTIGLLIFAATNRYFLAGRVGTAKSAVTWLRATIIAELLLFLAIFVTTAWLTTWHSPHEREQGKAEISGPITINDPWAPATIGNLPTAAGYLTIVNNMKTDDRLISASSEWAENVTLHVSTSEGRIAKMVKLNAPIISAGGQLKFSPGGNHLMLTGLYSPLVAGDTVPVSLRFERTGDVTVMLRVLPLGERPTANHNH